MAEEQVLRPGPEGVMLIPDYAYPRAFTLRVGDTDQSYVDLDDPRRLEYDYVQRIADVLDAVAEPAPARVRAVHVGGAAMTLPRYISATRPQSAQVVLEPDEELTAFVRQQLPLPPRSGIKVRAVDGRSGVAALRPAYVDFLVVDAFVGARVPADLSTAAFFADARRALSEHAVLIMNVTDRGPFGYTRRVLAGLGQAFGELALAAEPSTLKGRRFGNVIVIAAAAPLPLAEIARRAGMAPFPYRVLHGARLAQLVAGAAPFTDSDGEESPAPPGGLTHFA